ncbi:MAG TPA: hypothetical protein VNN19_12350, partial [bacterium]|nr:hypothetical protein [bacterium]
MASRIVLVAVIALALTVAGVQAQQDSAEEGGGDRASARAQPPDATATPLPQRPRQAYFEAGGEVMEAGALAEQLGLLEEPAATA